MPNFSETNRLERLELQHCSELREIHGSIGKLQRLKYLNLRNCYSLHGLPNEIGSLVDLEELQVGGLPRKCPIGISGYSSSSDGHFKIVDIPDCIGGLAKLRRLAITEWSPIIASESLGNLESLIELNLSRNERIRELPSSFGGLLKLARLDLQGCRNLEVLPESFGCLELLTELDLSYTKISELPSSFGGLVKLKRLDLEGCRNLEVLPESFGGLVKLELLDLQGCSNLEVLPESFGCLESLTNLTLSDTKISELPNSVGGLVKLKSLNLGGCRNLEVLPDTLGSLRELNKLVLWDCNLRKLPAFIGLMKKLQVIDISFGPAVDAAVEEQVLMEIWSISSLWSLRVSSRSLQKTPDLSRLTNLTNLRLLNSDDYRWPQQQLPKSKFEGIDKLTNLEDLELGVANASALLQFDLTGSLTQLNSLTLDFRLDLNLHEGSVLPSASSLDVLGTSQARLGELKLPDLSCLKNLSELVLRNCMIEDGGLLESLGIQHLRNFTSLTLSNCGSVPDLSELKTLRSLKIWGCKEVVETPGLGNLESLGRLHILGCNSLERLENLSKLEKLFHFTLWRCPKLRIVEGTERLALSELYIGRCRSLQNVDELKKRSKGGEINGFEFVNFG